MSNPNPFELNNKRSFNSNINYKSFDELMTDSTSKVSVAESERKTKMAIFVLMGALILAGLGVAGYFLSRPVIIDRPVITYEVVQSSAQSGVEVEELETIASPLKNLAKDLPVVEPGAVSFTVEGNSITPSVGTPLSFKEGITIASPAVACEVSSPQDFCLVATGKLKDSAIEVFFLKDAARSKMFDNSISFEKIEIPPAPIAALIGLGADANSLNVIVIINSDSSGYMIKYPTGVDPKNIYSLIEGG